MSATDLPAAEPGDKRIAHEHLEAAAEWFARLRDDQADDKTRRDWHDWLQQHADHQAAWEYVMSVRQRFAVFQADNQGRTAASVLQDRQDRRLTRRQVLGAMVGVAGAGLFGWIAYSQTSLPGIIAAWRADQRTATGEIRELALGEGLRLWLNTASAVNTHIGNGTHQIALLQGEILVATSGKPERSLYVTTDQGTMRPLGTQFAVRRQAQATLLAVYEGAVEIRTMETAERRRIEAGEQVTFTATGIGAVETADPARKAWARGVLLAENITLGELIAELARYQYGHLGVSPAVADLRVLGGYPLRDTDKTLSMLEAVLPIRIKRPLPWWTTVEPAR